jgi:HK97 family phage prohead protease
MTVKYPERLIEVIAVPYERPTEVLHHGRAITEVISAGAFDGVETRANSFKVFRAHNRELPIGRVEALHPRRPEGLIAEIHVTEGPSGDDTLSLAADQLLGASIGFGVWPGDDHWSDGHTHRRVTRAFLDHIALTGDPAYPDAKVLVVRRTAEPAPLPATPILDRIIAERHAREYGLTL